MKHIMILFLFLLIGCDFVDQKHFEIDKGLSPFVDQFYIEARNRGIKLEDNLIATIRFCKANEALGESVSDSVIPEIHIDPAFFNSRTHSIEKYYQIQIVVFHELGHALLHRQHTIKRSVMRAEYNDRLVFDYERWDSTRTSLHNELFSTQ